MKLLELSSLTALVLLCSFYRFEAFVHTKPKDALFVGKSSSPLMTLLYSKNDLHGGRLRRADDLPPHKGRRRRRKQHRKFDRKPRNDSRNQKEEDDRRLWLRNATEDILGKAPGSLGKGKWHELVSMIKGWSKFAKMDPEAPILIERLIKRLHDERLAGNERAAPDVSMYNALLDAWCCVGLFATNYRRIPNSSMSRPLVASLRAKEILVHLQQNYETTVLATKHSSLEDKLALVQPTEESFGLVFDVVLKIEGIPAARRFLAWMEYLSKTGRNELAKPGPKYYIRLLNAYANSRESNAGVLAEGILRHMIKIGEVPDTVCYNIAMKAWTKAKRGRESAEHADRILEEMTAPKDVITYSTVIAGWSASGMRSHAVVRAEELLREIEATPGLEPNTVVLNSIMSAWVKSKDPATVNRTTELLGYMESSANAPADLVSYNTHFHALSIHSHQEPDYAQRAHDALVSLERKYRNGEIRFAPNLFSYNIVIEAWCRSQTPDAAWKAAKLLRSFMNSNSKYKPDTCSFNQVLSALSRCTKPGTSMLAENLLDYMEIAYNNGVFPNSRPDVVSYSSVIVTLARNGETDAAERGEALLNRLKEHYESGKTYMKPTRVVYNAIIDAWAKSGRGTYGARRAEALLKEMEEMCAMGDVSLAPTVITYNAILNSWASSGTRCAGNMAVKYLDRMTMLNGTQGDIIIRPNDRTFNTVINAIAKSDTQAKAQKSLRVLRRMDKLYQSGYRGAKPNAVIYNSVLNAAAFPSTTADPKTKRKALDTAIFTLRELQESTYGKPTELTYSTFMKACSNLLSSDDDDESLRDVIEETFHQCKQDGVVGEMFLSRLREAAPEDLYENLLSEVVVTNQDTVKVEDLPKSWRCNVQSTKATTN